MLLNAYTWTGADQANPTLWEDAGNWSPAGYPSAASDTATFGSAVGNCTATNAETIGALTINSTYTGTLKVNVALLFAGGKMAGGTVTLPSSATFEVASGTFAMSAGAVTLSSGSNGPAPNPDVVLTPGFLVAQGATLTLTGAETIGVTLKNNGTTNANGCTTLFTTNAGILNNGTLNLNSATFNISAGNTGNLSNGGNVYNLTADSTSALAVVNAASTSLLEIDAGALSVTGHQDGAPLGFGVNQTAGTITIKAGAELDALNDVNHGGGVLQTVNTAGGTKATIGANVYVSGGSVIVATNASKYGTLNIIPNPGGSSAKFTMTGGTLAVGVNVPAGGIIGAGDQCLLTAAQVSIGGTSVLSVTTTGNVPVSGVSKWMPIVGRSSFTGAFAGFNWNGGYVWRVQGNLLYAP